MGVALSVELELRLKAIILTSSLQLEDYEHNKQENITKVIAGEGTQLFQAPRSTQPFILPKSIK